MQNEEKFLETLSELLQTDEDENGKDFFCHEIVGSVYPYSTWVLKMIYKVKELVEERKKDLKYNKI